MLRELQGRLLKAILEGTPFAGVDPDGLELTRLVVKKLRFELIVRGDAEMDRWFDRDPAAFTEAFRKYDLEVAPREWFPRQEAESFRAWCESRNLGPRRASNEA